MLRLGLLLAIAVSASKAATVQVSTPLGSLRGFENSSVITFLGVPYALPPTGERRFQPPQPPAPWDGTLDATRNGPVCYQEPLPLNVQNYLVNQSENCLTLDIFVDGNEIKPDSKMPVMIYIHGGAFTLGFSSNYKMNNFVAGKGIIAVVIQYRLGLFGFAQSPDEKSIPGNNGLVDQVAAIQWVKKYISNFGGDPQSITLAGESAGSISIAYHLVSPLSAGLFNRAIMQSGSHATMKLLTKEQVNANMQSLIEKANCNSLSDPYECLRFAPVDQLTRAQSSMKPLLSFNLIGSNAFLPSMDSRFFGGIDPQVKVKTQNFTSKLDSLIIGHNGNEGALFLMFSAPLIFPPVGRPLGTHSTKIEVQALAYTVSKKFRGGFQKLIDATFEDKFVLKRSDMLNKMGKISGDSAFGCPHREFVQSIVKFSPETKVYYYHFTYRPSGKTFAPYIEEALHGEDVGFTYKMMAEKKGKFSEQDLQLSETIVDNWTNFIKTGKVSDKKWLDTTYTSSQVQFNHIAFVHPTHIDYRAGFPANFCDRIKSIRFV